MARKAKPSNILIIGTALAGLSAGALLWMDYSNHKKGLEILSTFDSITAASTDDEARDIADKMLGVPTLVYNFLNSERSLPIGFGDAEEKVARLLYDLIDKRHFKAAYQVRAIVDTNLRVTRSNGNLFYAELEAEIEGYYLNETPEHRIKIAERNFRSRTHFSQGGTLTKPQLERQVELLKNLLEDGYKIVQGGPSEEAYVGALYVGISASRLLDQPYDELKKRAEEYLLNVPDIRDDIKIEYGERLRRSDARNLSDLIK